MKGEKFLRAFPEKTLIRNGRKRVAELDKGMEELAIIFNLAGNSARLKILFLLQGKHPLCVCDLSDILKMKTPAISEHLRRMKDVGIISNEQIGQTVYYYLEPDYREVIGSLLDLLNQMGPHRFSMEV